MLLSSTGFSIDLHYCQGQIKSVSLLGKAKSCHEKAAKSHCKKGKKACHAAPTLQNETKSCKKDCCSNETIKFEPNDEPKDTRLSEVTSAQIQVFAALLQVLFLTEIDLDRAIIPHLNYVPPLLDKDICVLIQSFLL